MCRIRSVAYRRPFALEKRLGPSPVPCARPGSCPAGTHRAVRDGAPTVNTGSYVSPAARTAAAILALVLVATELAGCGIGRQSRSERRQAALASLSVGMSREQVLSLMGKPRGREIRGQAEFLIYVTNPRAQNPSERYTQIAIVDGRVVGWDQRQAEPATEPVPEPSVRAR